MSPENISKSCHCFTSSSSSPRQLLSYRFLLVFSTVDTGKGWNSQVCSRVSGDITTCHKGRHCVSLPDSQIHLHGRASTFSSWPDNVLSALSADSSSSRWNRAHLSRWPRVHLGWSLCHAIQLIVHRECPTPLPAMWYQHLVVRCKMLFFTKAIYG